MVYKISTKLLGDILYPRVTPRLDYQGSRFKPPFSKLHYGVEVATGGCVAVGTGGWVAVGTTAVSVGGIAVSVGGIAVPVGGIAVPVGGIAVVVGV